jgi:uncharacterized protein YybS (DUF2232 family)
MNAADRIIPETRIRCSECHRTWTFHAAFGVWTLSVVCCGRVSKISDADLSRLQPDVQALAQK